MAGFGGAFTWADAVADVAPDRATDAATAKTADFCGVQPPSTPCVATVATVARWKEGVLSLETGPRAIGIAPREWRRLVADAQLTLRAWGYELAEAGWTTLEVFGTNANPLHRSMTKVGLVGMLGGNVVESVSADAARIRHNRKDCTTFYRRLITPGGVPIWDLVREIVR